MKSIISTFIIASVFLASCGTGSIKNPEYRDIQSIRIRNIGVLQSTAEVDLVYYNPNSFGVQLTEGRGDVYIDNIYLGRFELDRDVKVGKRSEFVVPALIKLDMIGAIKNHRDIYKKKEALVRIEGSARVKKAGMGMSVPIRYEGMQNIEKFRSIVSR